jgi:hypothetical protein
MRFRRRRYLGFIIEIIFGTIIDGIFELWTNFMKKRHPGFDNSHYKKVFIIVIGVLMTIVTTILILGIIILILKIIHYL